VSIFAWFFWFMVFFWPLALSSSIGGWAWAVLIVWLALLVGTFVWYKKTRCNNAHETAFGTVYCSRRHDHVGRHTASAQTGRKGWRGQKKISSTYNW
jgi:hypothetical protein